MRTLSTKYWVKPDIDNRISEGSITGLFLTSVRSITPTVLNVVSPRGPEELPADAVFLLTGYHPDWALLEAAGVQIDADRRVARYDPETLETSVPSLFLAGVVVSGRDVPPVFIENGRAHGEKIVRTLKERL